MARETCARASLCLEDPSACEEALDAGGVILVLLMLLLPIAVACGSPCFEDRLRRLLRLMLHRFGRRDGGAENTAADDDGHGGRGPRRALAGRCLASGALVPLLTVILAVVPTVLMLLAAPAPCATGLGGCGSISCVCGSYYSQGYVFMFSTLLLLAYSLLCEVARIDGSTMRGRRLRLAMAAGSLGTLLTAVFPEHLERGDGNYAAAFTAAYTLHQLGLAAACLLSVAAPAVALWAEARRPTGSGGRALLPSPLETRGRTLHLTAAAVASAAFLLLRGTADVSDYCAPLTRPAECDAWPSLPPHACRHVSRPRHYTCAFSNSSLSADDLLLMPPGYVAKHAGECRKARCTLFRNVRSIAAEFAALLLLCTYVVSHGLPDAQRIAAAAAAADRADGGGGASVCGAEREGTTRPLVMATENGVCRR
ncbi:hypothetical protein EMIHUDRAFT_424861 [Emiliania huxleyi CCMP1516]|uniref:Uncharacterized protein n=2 Tax=Emiliania huxleyi TaxID=2903 RepID=A0A0D3J6I2_EMIH1|nr:hypothetical protein EMIHUDRAFT_424861 [Emiliania huxleyi CCMP1516]EOD19117.1 hypothetical protein EMIHUDRAFT_424861 [Emiliania huxleyi CCMP1516]|eukprot:XP_005771546.1 hypothetical protein EMIHUDRAFT_424861 [Emiliania huxleyi CCMP1516]